MTAASRLSTGTNKFTECGDKTYLSAMIPCCCRIWIALNGKSEETPPKQVRLTELKVSRCLRKSLLLSSVRSKVSSDSESQVIIMRVLPAVKLEARSCGQDRLFCLRCCANFSKPSLRSLESISTCSMRAIELTARTFPFSMPATSFITCVLFSVPHHCL